MYEEITFEDILERILDRVPETFDKREGSVIYDAIAPCAVEIKNIYIELDGILNEGFADTASLEYLKRKASERGIIQNPATNAILKAVSTPPTVEIPINSRFSLNELNYTVVEKISDGEYKLQCETVGSDGNLYVGSLIPIDYIEGLETIEITQMLIPGEDAEDVEELRERYFDSIDSQAYGGNIADYKSKVLSIAGVGGVKITPVWNGGGTVKVTFVDATFKTPSTELVSNVQAIVDPLEHQGKGYGVAPIGHVVTVVGAETVNVDITTDITYADNWSWDNASTDVKKEIDAYFLELSKGWDATNDTALMVRISQLESRILQCDGVIDIANTTLNGSASNIPLTKEQIAVRGLINGK